MIRPETDYSRREMTGLARVQVWGVVRGSVARISKRSCLQIV
jgi:hypothetical protein